MSENKRTVEKTIDGLRNGDHGQVLACLTDDIEWVMPGAFRLSGKTAFDREIENDAFAGRPTIVLTRLTEENDVVVAEGSVRRARRQGGFLHAVFCDVFQMRERKIRHLTTHLTELKEPGPRERAASARTPAARDASQPTERQLEYLAFISRYMQRFGRAPAERDIERHFLVSAPSVNQMMQMLERRGFITRQAGVPRSTRIRIDLDTAR